MKGLGSKNMLFLFRFSCLFTFRKHKQQFGGILKNAQRSSMHHFAAVRLIWNLVGTSGQVLGIVWYVCFVYIIVCLHFVNVNKENTLYGSFGRLRVKSFETWWMSSLNPNTQSWVFFCWFDGLFMFYGYKQTSRFGGNLKKR